MNHLLLNARFSGQMEHDFKTYYGINAEEELIKVLDGEIEKILQKTRMKQKYTIDGDTYKKGDKG